MNANLIRAIDKYIGNMKIAFLSFFPRIKRKKLPKKILCIKIWTLGETLLTLPTIKKIEEEGYEITILCTKKNRIVYEESGINLKIIEFNLSFLMTALFKINKYPYAIDFEPYFRFTALLSYWLSRENIGYKTLFRSRIYKHKIKYDESLHTTEIMAQLIRPLNIHFIPKKLIPLVYADKDKEKVDAYLKSLKKPLIGIHAGGAASSESSSSRMYPKEEFAKIAAYCAKKGTVLLTGTDNEYEINQYIIKNAKTENILDIAKKFSLTEFAYLLTRLKIYISNDTGPMHLAAAMGCKTIGIFGPELPHKFGPFPLANNTVITSKEKCPDYPCINVHKGLYIKCKYNQICMKSITKDQIINEIDKNIK
jgi:heptosyltransferase II